jgi:hypothetical protein
VAAASAKAAAAEAALAKRRKREAAAARGVKLQQAAQERDKLLALNQVKHTHQRVHHVCMHHTSVLLAAVLSSAVLQRNTSCRCVVLAVQSGR